ncbi:MAG TPA: hypothetical protein PKK48_07620 [Phycisphaerae bacterium]|nr:hypothetical protein [Phycisphaerae bacterium]HPS52892.1 hypothetical protein [Phycisphaerae bacterium]
MRFIGNHHALHFGGHTFINDVTLINTVIREMINAGKPAAFQEEVTDIITQAVHKVEQELRDELRQKHYHQDLQVQDAAAAAAAK